MFPILRWRPFLLVSLVLFLVFSGMSRAESYLSLPADAQALITTSLDPANYVVTSPSPFDGVARLIVTMPSGTFGCSGSLLAGGQFVVTAGHCISDGSLGASPTVSALSAAFPDGQVRTGSAYYVSPDWTGDFDNGGDIALVRLATPAVGIPGYGLYRGADPTGVIDVAGYGLSGLGATGTTLPFGTLRAGQNTLDDVVWTIVGSPYAWDFDNGLVANDALCLLIGVCNTGLGANEAMIAPGDSGGPSFFGGELIGVHSFRVTFGRPIDVDAQLNSSFGELAGDTRVNHYAAWIDSVTVPEPGSMLLLGSGLVAWLAWGRRRRA